MAQKEIWNRIPLFTLAWGQGKLCPFLVAKWPWPKVTEMGSKIFSHTHRLTMCGLKKLASGVVIYYDHYDKQIFRFSINISQCCLVLVRQFLFECIISLPKKSVKSLYSIMMLMKFLASANQIAQIGSCYRSRIHVPDLGGTGVWPGKNGFHKKCKNLDNIAVLYLIASLKSKWKNKQMKS